MRCLDDDNRDEIYRVLTAGWLWCAVVCAGEAEAAAKKKARERDKNMLRSAKRKLRKLCETNSLIMADEGLVEEGIDTVLQVLNTVDGLNALSAALVRTKPRPAAIDQPFLIINGDGDGSMEIRE